MQLVILLIYILLSQLFIIDSGDHDMNFPYVGTEQWIKSFNLPIESPWDPWFVNTQIAG